VVVLLLATGPVHAKDNRPDDWFGYEISVGADVAAPLQLAATTSLLLGRRFNCDFLFCTVQGGLLEVRLGLAGADLAVGLATSSNKDLIGAAVLFDVTRTWQGPAGDPWFVPSRPAIGQMMYGGRLQAMLWGVTVSAGLAHCPCAGAETVALLSLGYRFAPVSAAENRGSHGVFTPVSP
jgi:hypothetical protein